MKEVWGENSFRTPPTHDARRPATEHRGRDMMARSNPQAELSQDPTSNIFVYDLDPHIPARDLEQGLTGLFSVFGTVNAVVTLPGKCNALM